MQPEAYDYTTIPGLKCERLPLTKKAIVLADDDCLDDIAIESGNLDDIRRFDDVAAFFSWLHAFYGPLAAFFYGRRYVVSIGSVEVAQELQQYAHAKSE